MNRISMGTRRHQYVILLLVTFLCWFYPEVLFYFLYVNVRLTVNWFSLCGIPINKQKDWKICTKFGENWTVIATPI